MGNRFSDFRTITSTAPTLIATRSFADSQPMVATNGALANVLAVFILEDIEVMNEVTNIKLFKIYCSH